MWQEEREALKIVLEFVERWNKEDNNIDVAEAAVILQNYLIEKGEF